MRRGGRARCRLLFAYKSVSCNLVEDEGKRCLPLSRNWLYFSILSTAEDLDCCFCSGTSTCYVDSDSVIISRIE